MSFLSVEEGLGGDRPLMPCLGTGIEVPCARKLAIQVCGNNGLQRATSRGIEVDPNFRHT